MDHRQAERRQSQQKYGGQDRRKPGNGASAENEERMRQQEQLRMQDQMDRPETD